MVRRGLSFKTLGVLSCLTATSVFGQEWVQMMGYSHQFQTICRKLTLFRFCMFIRVNGSPAELHPTWLQASDRLRTSLLERSSFADEMNRLFRFIQSDGPLTRRCSQ